jgi:hypothetical protein
MKTHYLRLGILDDPAPGVIERWNIYPRHRNLRINAKLSRSCGAAFIATARETPFAVNCEQEV